MSYTSRVTGEIVEGFIEVIKMIIFDLAFKCVNAKN